MKHRFLSGLCGPIACFFFFTGAGARPAQHVEEISVPDVDVDIVGDVEGGHAPPRRALADTIWIAEWTFDAPGGSCTDEGWEQLDNYIKNDGRIYWAVGSAFAGTGGIDGQAAVLGYTGNPCCVEPDGYDNDWYQAIRLQYSGTAMLSFDYLLDPEEGYDFLQVETDSACASFERVDRAAQPLVGADQYRRVELSDSGIRLAGQVEDLVLTDHGPGTHCVYIAFVSDGAFSPCDGLQPSTLGSALVVDNIQLSDAGGAYNQDFEGGVGAELFANLKDSAPFGEWGRLFRHVTDNDACTENSTCAWLWTDHTTPTLATDPSTAYGPGTYVVRYRIDNIIVSPWVSLASTPNASGTVLRFRRFPGNFFTTSRIQANWSVRGKKTVQGEECISNWGHAFQFNTLGAFSWLTFTADMTPNFDPQSTHVQVRHRVTDSRVRSIGGPPPILLPGPGPYTDDTRIGRVVLAGPVLSEGTDARSQAQDCFPTEIRSTPGAGEHFRATTDRFGTCALSQGADLKTFSTNLVTGDSIWIQVEDARGAGGITVLEWHGAVVAGPHAGKAPAPYTVGTNGFFVVAPSPARSPSGQVVEGRFFVDVDDTYFRGGDVLHYFWLAQDALGGTGSDPDGLNGVPVSVEAVRQATGGLLEVSFLPAIRWDAGYLARLAADPHGDLDPTPTELAGSTQENCILYINHLNARRRSGDANRTSFMYTLDVLGYRGHYDAYDHSGMGNTNNHLGGRATIEQARGYSLIVYDAGNAAPGRPILPEGFDQDMEKVDQAGWFRSWLAQAGAGGPGFATLWIIGSDALEEKPANPCTGTTWGRCWRAPARCRASTPTSPARCRSASTVGMAVPASTSAWVRAVCTA